jgi:hypothetical protein
LRDRHLAIGISRPTGVVDAARIAAFLPSLHQPYSHAGRGEITSCLMISIGSWLERIFDQ